MVLYLQWTLIEYKCKNLFTLHPPLLRPEALVYLTCWLKKNMIEWFWFLRVYKQVCLSICQELLFFILSEYFIWCIHQENDCKRLTNPVISEIENYCVMEVGVGNWTLQCWKQFPTQILISPVKTNISIRMLVFFFLQCVRFLLVFCFI